MPRRQESFDPETAVARQRLIQQLQQLSKAFQRCSGEVVRACFE